MASFTSSGVTSAAPNILANIPGAIAAGQSLQQNALALSDRQDFRDNAAGLAARDSTATAAALSADPTAAISYLQTIPYADQNRRTQSAADQAALGSAAGSILNAAPGQRQALWSQARQQLIAGGHANVPGPDYPGDAAMLAAHNTALSSQEQLAQQGQALTTSPQSPLQAIPGGASAPSSTAPPQAPGAAVAPSGADAMAQRESGGNASAISPLGYVGKYQMGSGALADIGAYTPAQGENPNGNTWRGQFSVPGYPEVKTLSDFLASPDAQDAAYGAHVDAIDQAIDATPGVDRFDPSGLLAVAHLGGITGMRKFVQTNMGYNPADPNGTTLVDYYAHFSGHHPGGMLADLRQRGIAGVKSVLVSGGTYGPPDANGIPTVQLAANQPSTGGQPVATDAPAQMLPAVPATPSPADVGFNRMLSGIYAPPPPAASNAAVSPVSAGGAVPPNTVPASPPPADTPNLPASIHSNTPPGTPRFRVIGPDGARPNALAAVPGGAPASAAPLSSSGPTSNLLAFGSPGASPSSALPTPNALVGGGPASPFAPAGGGMQPLFRGNSYVEAPGMPGYVLGVDAAGNRGVMRMPGAPPAKPPETKFVGGTMVQTDGVDGHVLNVVPNMVPDPSRMAQVQGAGPNGTNGTTMFQDGKPVGFVPASTQPIQMEAYKADLARAGMVAQQATDAEQQVQRALEARNYANGLPTGAGGEDRAQLATWLQTYAPSIYPSFVKSGWLPDAPQAEEAAKVMLSQAAQDEKTMGGSGGLGLTEKYAKANPSLNMTPQAIQAMSNLKAVTAQSAKDYADGYLQNFNAQAANFTKAGGQYQPAAAFDQAWHGQPNVQTYMAAIGAVNGEPYAKWSAGLSPLIRQRALGVVARVDPTSIVNGASGRIRVDGQPSQAGGAPAASVPTATGPNGQKLYLRNGAWAPQ